MRVLLVTHYGLPHIGGVESEARDEIAALAEAGHDVTHLTSTVGGAGGAPDYPSSVRVVRAWMWNVAERRFELAYPVPGPSWVRHLLACVRDADVVHAHGAIFLPTVLAVVAARLHGVPSVVTDHGGLQRYGSTPATLLARLAFETIGRLVCRLATRVFAMSDRVKDDLSRLRGGRVDVVATPLDTSVYRPADDGERDALRARLGWEPGRPKVLFVGRLLIDKGVRLLLEASDPAFDLVFCGPGDPSVLRLAARTDVEYLPPTTARDVADLYRAADVFVAPSMREGGALGLSRTTREALLCGRACVVTSVDDPASDPPPGLLVSQPHPDDLRTTIMAAVELGRVPTESWTRALAIPRPSAWVETVFGELGRGG